jgi:predicted MPP superfamily phosphohydrolase
MSLTVALGVFALFSLAGHLALWIGIYNQLHATAVPCGAIKIVEKFIYLAVLLLPLGGGWFVAARGFRAEGAFSLGELPWYLLVYLVLCGLALAAAVGGWVKRQWAAGPVVLRSNDTQVFDVAEQLGSRPIGDFGGRVLAGIPGNEILTLHVHQKELTLPRLPAALDGLTIVHLSDLHFTGRLTRPFFDFIVDRALELNGDLIAVTGDIIDKAHCLDWLQPTLGRLHCPHGSYFVLGNHDKRLRAVAEIRRRLTAAGLVDLGGRMRQLAIRGQDLFLAGNELPWFGPAPEMPPSRRSDAVSAEFRILLSHSPDQIRWARRHDFDLVLAGHTHGGQIRLPVIGPIVAPSRFGVKYASGLFVEEQTVMHVSRGLSALHALRFNCPPELTKLVLRTP